MFRDKYHQRVKKDLSQLDRSVINEIKNIHIPKILENPLKGEKLTADFSGIYSHHFRKNKIDYRVCYLLDSEEQAVFILMIGKRENFYKLLKRRFL